jgi:hypothetical protein
MKSNRSFTRKNGKLEIKAIVEQDNDMTTLENGRISIANHADKGYQVFLEDLRSIIDKRTCAFIRPYIPGEYDGFKLPNGLDLNEITHVFVVIGDPESHVESHLQPLGTTFKAVCFTIEEGMPTLARIPLLPEQVEVLKQNGEKE